MKAALFLLFACAILCALPARAADELYRRSGFEVGAWRWIDREYPPDELQRYYIVSVGRWERVRRGLTWITRAEYGDLQGFPGPGGGGVEVAFGAGSVITEGERWYDVGHSLTLETGLELHPPVTAGLAPFVGLSGGIGVARWGDEHTSVLIGQGWITSSTKSGRSVPAIVAGGEIGLRVFPSGHWPSVCAAVGYRVVMGPHGSGFTSEPVVSIGY
jgi:hypothetical protein